MDIFVVDIAAMLSEEMSLPVIEIKTETETTFPPIWKRK
jgi:hypothetical protein